RKAGLPEGFENRLTGSTKEEWQKDAQQLAGLFKKPYPSKNHVEPVGDSKNVDLKKMLKALRGED
uniref:hypothetical protein n=1 Tax=Faecalibaculum rodentium TaxID=1702221 RepID=UPI0025A96910